MGDGVGDGDGARDAGADASVANVAAGVGDAGDGGGGDAGEGARASPVRARAQPLDDRAVAHPLGGSPEAGALADASSSVEDTCGFGEAALAAMR